MQDRDFPEQQACKYLYREAIREKDGQKSCVVTLCKDNDYEYKT